MSQIGKLGYDWHPSGEFLIRKICRQCAEPYDVHALSNAMTTQAILGLCHACEALRQREGKGTI